MARFKTLPKKKRLAKAQREIKPVPAWVIAKSGGRVRSSPKRRHWRRTRIRL